MSFFAGLDELTISDRREPITFPMLVMYPTAVSSKPVSLGPYTFDVAHKAPIQDGLFPLVMISHGTGSSNQVFRTLAAHLAKNGFIVCMPEHPFNNRNNNERSGTVENLIDRPRHISEALDCILSHATYAKHIKDHQIAVIGHSMGGYTALALAGGHPHTMHQMEHDPHTKITRSEAVDVHADNRIKAVVLFAPAAGWYKSPDALRNVTQPILILSGEHDTITPLFHAEIIKDGVPDRTKVIHRIVKNGTHFSFLSPFPESMTSHHFPPSQDREGFDRANFLDGMNAEVLEFLTNTLTQ